MRPRHTLLVLALALALTVPAPSTRADTMGGMTHQIVLYTVGGAGLVVSLYGVIANSVYLADGERSPWTYQLVGYGGATLLIAGGSFGFVDGGTVPQVVGGLGIALGVAEIVVTALAGLQPEAVDAAPTSLTLSAQEPSPRYAVSPFIAPTSAGEAAYGLTLSIHGF